MQKSEVWTMDSFLLIVLYVTTAFGSGKCISFFERPEKGGSVNVLN